MDVPRQYVPPPPDYLRSIEDARFDTETPYVATPDGKPWPRTIEMRGLEFWLSGWNGRFTLDPKFATYKRVKGTLFKYPVYVLPWHWYRWWFPYGIAGTFIAFVQGAWRLFRVDGVKPQQGEMPEMFKMGSDQSTPWGLWTPTPGAEVVIP